MKKKGIKKENKVDNQKNEGNFTIFHVIYWMFRCCCITPLMLLGIDLKKMYASTSKAARSTLYYGLVAGAVIIVFIVCFLVVTSFVYFYYFSRFPVDKIERSINFSTNENNTAIAKVLLQKEGIAYSSLCTKNDTHITDRHHDLERVCSDLRDSYFDQFVLSPHIHNIRLSTLLPKRRKQ